MAEQAYCTSEMETQVMELQTERLILRPWREEDAESLFLYAKDPAVGPIAGWPAHQSVEESLEVIRTVFSVPETYAIILRETGSPIGCIGLKTGDSTDLTDRIDECELGYWLGVPYWGKGLMTEAATEMIRHAFEHCGMNKIWCGYYDGNIRSKRVQEKCGFIYQWENDNVDVPLMHETRKGFVSCLTKEEWMNRNKSQDLPHALWNGNWKHVSDNATEISLHDHYITKFIREGNDIILYFEEGFFIDKTHPENNTGEHQFTTASAIILQDANLIGSEERAMDGTDSPSHAIQEGLLFTDSCRDVLVGRHTWSPQKQIFGLVAFCENPSLDLDLRFHCSRVLICWNEFAHGDWVNKWHDLWGK